jgi:hypothetical protein
MDDRLFILFIIIGWIVYFIPTMVAGLRHHPWVGSIVVINIGLGWTVVGWVIALAWAVAGRISPSGHGSDADSRRSDDPWPRRGLLDEVTR